MHPDLAGLLTGPIEVVGCHAGGEIGDVVVGGIVEPPGASVWEKSRWVAADGRLRALLLNEPRGGVIRHVNLLVAPAADGADVGFVILEPEDTPPMSGSNAMCVATVVLETGIVAMEEPVTTLCLEAPAGPVEVTAACRDGKVESVSIRNVASFVAARDVMLEVPGHGTIRVDTAWGGDSFVMVDAADLGVTIDPAAGRELAALGATVTAAANEQLGFEHPTTAWDHISFCQIAGPLTGDGPGRWSMTNTVVVEPGKLDRSPTGTGLSARLALLAARGTLAVGDQLTMRSVIGSEFSGVIQGETEVGDRPAIVPVITGQAWRTGRSTYEVDPGDPFPFGYRVADTWPARHSQP